MRKHLLWVGKEMNCAPQLSTMQSAYARAFRCLSWNRQRGRYICLAPFEPGLAFHDQVKSFLRFHPSFPISLGFPAEGTLGITTRTPAKPLSCGQVTAFPVVDNAEILVDERIRAKLDVSHARDRQWRSQVPFLTYPQGPKVALGPLSI